MYQLMSDFSNWIETTWAGDIFKAFSNVFAQSIEGWVKFFADVKALFEGFHPSMPSLQIPGDQQPIISPDGVPLPQAPGNGAMRGKPMRYQAPSGGPGVQRIHVTFEADVPGRATVQQSGDSWGARGPMLIRA